MSNKKREQRHVSPIASSIGKWQKCARDIDRHEFNAPNAVRKIEEMLDFAFERAEKAILHMKTGTTTVKYTGAFSSKNKKVGSEKDVYNEGSVKVEPSVVHLEPSDIESSTDTELMKKPAERKALNTLVKFNTKSRGKDVYEKESWKTFTHVPTLPEKQKPELIQLLPHIGVDSTKKCKQKYKTTLQIKDSSKFDGGRLYSDSSQRSNGTYGSRSSNSTISSREPWITHIRMPASPVTQKRGQQVPHIYFDPSNKKKYAGNWKSVRNGNCHSKDTRISLSSSSSVSSKRASVSVVSPSVTSESVTSPMFSNSECNQSDCAQYKHLGSADKQPAISTALSHLHDKPMKVNDGNNNAKLGNEGVGFSFNFNVVLKDARGGSHPMHFLGDCQQNCQTGRMDAEQLFVNGRVLK